LQEQDTVLLVLGKTAAHVQKQNRRWPFKLRGDCYWQEKDTVLLVLGNVLLHMRKNKTEDSRKPNGD
jgi:hypothetical protein